jgi:hypothetical protein
MLDLKQDFCVVCLNELHLLFELCPVFLDFVHKEFDRLLFDSLLLVLQLCDFSNLGELEFAYLGLMA